MDEQLTVLEKTEKDLLNSNSIKDMYTIKQIPYDGSIQYPSNATAQEKTSASMTILAISISGK